MYLQYGTITSTWKSQSLWAQLCSIKWHTSGKEYNNVEVITPKWLNYLPSLGDIVVFGEVYNGEVILLWVLEQTDLSLKNGDVVIHRGVNTNNGGSKWYNQKTRIVLAEDSSITLESGDSQTWTFVPKASIQIKNDGSIKINCNQFEII